VEVITSHQGGSEVSKVISGFQVHYLPVYYDNKLRYTARILAFLKFAWLAYQKALELEQVRLCYAISTPLTVGWVAGRLKSRHNIPYVFEVGDLWPEAPVQMGVIKWPWLIKQLRRFERSIYQNAEHVVALSPGIRSGILKTAPESAISTIPNISDCQYFQLEPKLPYLEKRFGVTNKLVVTYFGAAGKANHLEYLIEAARYAGQNNPNLHFMIMASGSELDRLIKLAKRYKLRNLDFLNYRNRAELRKVLNVTDIVYVSYADVPVLTTGSPNKFFDGLAAGKVMVVNFEGWLKDITLQHQTGYYVDPEKPEMLTDVLGPLINDKRSLLQMQINSRILAETYFSRELAIKKLLKALINEETEPVREPEVYNLTA
jgi:glycosyltransferase involved in cell wall biosynthesis